MQSYLAYWCSACKHSRALGLAIQWFPRLAVCMLGCVLNQWWPLGHAVATDVSMMHVRDVWMGAALVVCA
jgi:hypothetical protein